MVIDMTARKAALRRLQDARYALDVAIQAVEHGWVNEQFARVDESIMQARAAAYDARAALMRGARRYKKRGGRHA